MFSRKLYWPVFVLPALLMIFMLLVFPVFYGFFFSLFKIRFLQIIRFDGLGNFIKVLTNITIVWSLVRAVVLSLVCAGGTMFLGTLLAYWINERGGFYALSIQLIGLIPWVISMVVGSLLWKWIFANDFGLLNFFLARIGLEKINILGKPHTAMATLAFVMIWRTVGYAMVMVLAGLKGVSETLLEASVVDGCNRWEQFRYVIFPSIKTPLLVSTIVVTLSNFNNVTVPLTLTGGGPGEATNVVSLELYRLGFVYNLYGSASALAVIVFLVNILLIVLYSRLVKWNIAAQ